MGGPYANTISGLLRKRSELMGDAQRLREQLAHVGNDIEALDRTLVALGHQGDLKTVQPRGNRIVFFARDELRRLAQEDRGRASSPYLLGCLVRIIGQPNHCQGHVDLLGERACFHNLALAMVGNSRQRRGANCPYVIERQRAGVKEPLSG